MTGLWTHGDRTSVTFFFSLAIWLSFRISCWQYMLHLSTGVCSFFCCLQSQVFLLTAFAWYSVSAPLYYELHCFFRSQQAEVCTLHFFLSSVTACVDCLLLSTGFRWSSVSVCDWFGLLGVSNRLLHGSSVIGQTEGEGLIKSAPRLYVTGHVRCEVPTLCWHDRGVCTMHGCRRSVRAFTCLSTDPPLVAVMSLGSMTVLDNCFHLHHFLVHLLGIRSHIYSFDEISVA